MKALKSGSLARTVILSSLLVGFLDGVAATVIAHLTSGIAPLMVFQYIASGVYGMAAFSGGWATALIGVLFHFMIAFSFTLLFFLIYPTLRALSKSVLLLGVVYGSFVWLVMNLLVLPLSHVSQQPFSPLSVFVGVATLIALMGMPLAWIVSRQQ